MQSENGVSADAMTCAMTCVSANTSPVDSDEFPAGDPVTVPASVPANTPVNAPIDFPVKDGKQITASLQGHRVRLALECLGSKSLTSRLKQTPSATSESVGTTDNCSDPGTISKNTSENSDDDKDNLNFTRVDDIRRALHALCTRQDTDLAAQLELLVRFDDLQGWRECGAKSCVAWMNASLSIDRRTGWERLRVGRQLRLLPIIQSLFRNGRLSWSKVRLLTRIADPDNEQMLAHASLDASVSDVQRLCEEFHWPADKDEATDDNKARQQYARRRLIWRQLPDGNLQIQLTLPPDTAQNFLHGLEHCEDLLYTAMKNSDTGSDTGISRASNSRKKADSNASAADAGARATIYAGNNAHADGNTPADVSPGIEQPISATQRRADAAVLMAERSLAFRGDDLAPADRFQVVLNVDTGSLALPAAANSSVEVADAASASDAENARTADGLSATSTVNDAENASAANTAKASRQTITSNAVPVRKPRIEGIGPVTVATARLIACDCSLFTLLSADGEPLSIGRKSRLWPASMRRAILTRDRHCQFPGCDSHRFLHIHHIVHWADGGETAIDNGVCLCQHHHQLIHSGEFSIERATVAMSSIENELTQGLFSSSKHRLLPSRCRFRVKRLRMRNCRYPEKSPTQSVNECRDGDLQWEYSSQIKSVHSSQSLHVDTPGHGSYFLPRQVTSHRAECFAERQPP